MEYEDLLPEKLDEGITIITLNVPEKLSASPRNILNII